MNDFLKNNLFFQLIYWHFFVMPRNIIKAFFNFFWFNLYHYSVSQNIKTYFSYWKNFKGDYGRGLNLNRYFEAFSTNIISRVIGAILRTFIILFAFILEIFIFLGLIITLFIWLFLPLFIFLLIYIAIKL
ncbi:MAG: hypothetical protein ACP5H7_00100 [Minisyncoccia bacterium]